MKKNIIRIIAVVLALTMLAVSFAGCSTSEVNRPVAVETKTDLQDVYFEFTYGELKNILPGDKLATLYENFNKSCESCFKNVKKILSLALVVFLLTGIFAGCGGKVFGKKHRRR